MVAATHTRRLREDHPPAAVDVRMECDVPHVGLAREIWDLVPDLKRPPSSAKVVTQLAATDVAGLIRHRNHGGIR